MMMPVHSRFAWPIGVWCAGWIGYLNMSKRVTAVFTE